jgi:hypothetical protein
MMQRQQTILLKRRAWLAAACLLSACVTNTTYTPSASFQALRAQMTRPQAEAVFLKTVQGAPNWGGLCAVRGYENVPGPLRVTGTKVAFAANQLIPIGTQAGNYGRGYIGVKTIYKRAPGQYEIDFATVTRVQVARMGDTFDATLDSCRGLLSNSDYRMAFEAPQMPGALFNLYARPDELDTVLAALAILAPNIEFHRYVH